MDSKPNPVYEDLEVHTEWVHEAADDTLIAYLPGFSKEQLKVQVTTDGKLRISGERPLEGNKFGRFSKEILIPSNCDRDRIRANFRGGMLNVKHPKLTIATDEKQEQAKPSAEVPKSDQKPVAPIPQRPADVPQKQNSGPEKAVQEVPPKTIMEKQTAEKTDGVAKEADNVSQKEPDKGKEMKDTSNAANESDKPMEEEKKGWDQREKTSTTEQLEKLGDSVQDAAEKEYIETKKLDGTDKYQLVINMVWLKCKQVLDGLTTGLRNPRKLINLVLAVLLFVVLAVYIRNVIRSPGNYEN
ncbi:inactive protein RESTRICTED TEV MOVEMENT 2-like [Durio zibethinus]|uniref:Inactive protein RESTRICTED TEV MOVEMENT 2-like n=1 Tax=Durio zibethinus TaxID=66656 RepID=A0A6P5XSV0_DURZI|nr:inactive protein RESTRICTED TEV MOVEMENT 2-like [Durio zibethinus]